MSGYVQNFKVTLQLGSPFYLQDRLGLDGLLSYAVFVQTGLQGKDTVPHIPLEREHGLLAGSCIFYAQDYQHQTFSRVMALKKEGDMQAHHFRPQSKRGGKGDYSPIDLKRDTYKINMDNYPCIVAKEVYFYGRGDMKKTQALLELIPGIGKRANTGAGEIIGIFVEESEDNYAFQLANATPARYIPVPTWEELGGKPLPVTPMAIDLPRWSAPPVMCVSPLSLILK